MARLILINGAPSSGKSTLARRYADDHPLTLDLDLDMVRSLLGGWLAEWSEAGVLTRRMALEMARVHLAGGRDVVVPQFLGRPDFVLELESLCASVGVPFVEVALVSSASEAASRFAARSRDPVTDAHRDAAALQERLGGPPEIPAMYARLLQVVEARPATRLVRSVPGDVEGTYRSLLEAVGR